MKLLRNLMFAAAALTVLPVAGCGGGHGKGGDSAADKTAIEQLKDIPVQLDTEVNKLMAPIDGIQGLLDEISGLPAKTGLNAKDIMGQVNAVLAGAPAPTLEGAQASAKTELDTLVAKVKQFKDDLTATPERVTSLAGTCAAMTAKLPVLATQITTETGVIAANPFASAEDKAKAKADAASVAQIQSEVTAKIGDTQGKITGIPAKAVEALAKLTAALAGG